jgi:homoserine/homoserine lactone efflux protein
MQLSVWLTFFLACWAISISPGPGAIAAMSSGLDLGFRRGYFTTFGLILGIWTQILLVVVGLGALIAASGTAFTVLKFAGAAYLVWLGIAQWRAGGRPLVAAAGDRPQRTRRGLVRRGWMINAVNPKGTVFLLAVVPQFLDLSRPLAPQYLVIAASLSFTDLVVMAGYTAFAARVLRTLDQAHHARWMNRTFGGLFMIAGSVLATYRRAAI